MLVRLTFYITRMTNYAFSHLIIIRRIVTEHNRIVKTVKRVCTTHNWVEGCSGYEINFQFTRIGSSDHYISINVRNTYKSVRVARPRNKNRIIIIVAHILIGLYPSGFEEDISKVFVNTFNENYCVPSFSTIFGHHFNFIFLNTILTCNRDENSIKMLCPRNVGCNFAPAKTRHSNGKMCKSQGWRYFRFTYLYSVFAQSSRLLPCKYRKLGNYLP